MAHLCYKVAYYKNDVLGKITHIIGHPIFATLSSLAPPSSLASLSSSHHCHPRTIVILSEAKDLVTPGKHLINNILNKRYA